MWTTEFSVMTTARREEVWELWSKVSEWNAWDHGIEYTTLHGAFVQGTTGVLKPTGGPAVSFVITECTPYKSFADRSALPFCTLEFFHSIKDTPQGLEVSHRVVMKGALTFLFSRIIGSGIHRDLPTTMARFVAMAEAASLAIAV